jgi:hypothetical protein
VYEAAKAKHKHAHMLAMNLLEKHDGCLILVAARNNNTQTSHKELPNEKLSPLYLKKC